MTATMNISQALHRLRQKHPFGNMFDSQAHQVELLKKLYAKNGLELRLIGSACPEQYDVLSGGVEVAYLRLRHGVFRVNVGSETFEAATDGDGAFDGDERIHFLAKAMRFILDLSGGK